MAVKNFREGIRLVPVSADPTGPIEGQVQYSDGTHRDPGLWQYKAGAWEQLAADPGLDPKCIDLINPRFEADTSGWTTGGAGTTSILRNTTTPLSGSGDLQVTTSASGTTGETDLANFGHVERYFSLSNRVEEGESVRVQFDLEFSNSQHGTSEQAQSHYDFMLISIVDQATSTLQGSTLVFDTDRVALEGKKYFIDVAVDITGSTDTDLAVRVNSFVLDPLVEKVADTVYFIDNVVVKTESLDTVKIDVQDDTKDPLIDLGINLGISDPIPNSVWEPVAFNIINSDPRALWTYISGATKDGYLTADRDMEINIQGSLELESDTFSQGQSFFSAIYVNNIIHKVSSRYIVPYTSATTVPTGNVNATIKINKGDTVQIRVFQNSGSTAHLRHSSGPGEIYNWVTIKVKDL